MPIDAPGAVVLLAPMEGVLDSRLRDVLSSVGGVTRCVSEFIRVTDTLLPERVFTRIVPELLQGGRTRSGVPVRPQLLGSDPVCLAENAERLASLSPHGVDLNFGCPAKVVNRHGGGASLLSEPELLARIVGAVRRAVPAHLPVSVKMRLGLSDDARALDCARALEQGGADEIVVHARTRDQGYRPPVQWARVGDIRQAVRVPVIVNGDICSPADARRARAESGCSGVMIGRGMVAQPGLARALQAARDARAVQDGPDPVAENSAGVHLPWVDVLPLLLRYAQAVEAVVEPRHRAGRLKQWVQALRRSYLEAEILYQTLRTETDSRKLIEALKTLAGRV